MKYNIINKLAINTYLSLITLKVNGLNIPIEKLKVADWIKIRPYIHAYKRLISELKTHMD